MKKLSIRPITYTILILIAIITFTCGESKSKYIKEDGSAIKYSVHIKKMSGTSLNALPHGKLSSSTYEEMKFFYSFNRSGNMLTTDISETYEIITKETCTITSITADNATIYDNLVTFYNIGNETITVYLNCNVEANTIGDYINVSLNVNNYFNNSLPKFAYTNGINNVSLSDYELVHPKPEITDFYSDDYKAYTMKNNRENKLEGLNTWLNLFANRYSDITYDNIYNYIDILKTIDELTDDDIALLNDYEGFNASIDADGNYVFVVDDRFISIVKSHSEKLSNDLYFYEGEYDIDELFLFYINYFDIYVEGSLEYTTIRDYIVANEVDNETILDLANRLKLGITFDNETKLLDGVEYLYDHIIYNVPTHKYLKSNIFPRKLATFTTNMNNITVLTGTDLLSQILDSNNTRLKTLFSITNTSTMFDGYIYYESSVDNKNAIVHIYSNDEEYTYVDITFVDSNILIYEYSNVDISSIKTDLDYISTTFYGSELSLLDTDESTISSFETLETGTYNLNIGTITVTGNKTVVITLKDRNITQNEDNEEENTVTEGEDELSVEDENTVTESEDESSVEDNTVTESEDESNVEDENTVTEGEEESSVDEENTVTESEDESNVEDENTVTEGEDESSVDEENTVTESEEESSVDEENTVTESEEESSVDEENTVTEGEEESSVDEENTVTEGEDESSVDEENTVTEGEEESSVDEENTVTEGEDESSVDEDNTVTESEDESSVDEDNTVTESEDESSVDEENTVTESEDESNVDEENTVTEGEDESSVDDENTVTEGEDESNVDDEDTVTEGEDESNVEDENTVTEGEDESNVDEENTVTEGEEESSVEDENTVTEGEDESSVEDENTVTEGEEESSVEDENTVTESEDESNVDEENTVTEGEDESSVEDENTNELKEKT